MANILIGAVDTKKMAPMGDTYAKTLLHLLEVSVVLSTQVGQALIVLGIEKKGNGLGGAVQSSTDAPSEAGFIITEVEVTPPTTSARKELGRATAAHVFLPWAHHLPVRRPECPAERCR